MSATPVLAGRGLVKEFTPKGRKREPFRAVDDVELAVGAGETLAVVGESGSGKSTIALALAGLLPAAAGSIAFTGASASGDLGAPVARRAPALRRAVQLVFQNADTSLNPRMSVGRQIRRPLRLFGRDAGRRRVDELLTEVGLDPTFASRLPGQLSGGQRQRVGIARALAAEPELIVADEITTALDVRVQAEILELLARLQADRGLACVFISHDLAVVRGVADRIAVMNGGRVVETGPAEAVFRGPNHPYTRQLLDAALEPGATELPAAADGPGWADAEGGGWDDEGGGHLIRRWRSA